MGAAVTHSQFANCEYNRVVALKSQDVYVVLKLVSAGSRRAPYAQLARELEMSASEVHAGIKRAQASGLLHGPALGSAPNVEQR